MKINKSLKSLIDLHDDPFYTGGHEHEKKWVDNLLAPFNSYSVDIDALDTHKKVLYFCMRSGGVLADRYRSYHKSVEPVSEFLKEFSRQQASNRFLSYDLADKTELKPLGANFIRINFNKRFVRNISISQTLKILQNLRDANLLVKHRNKYLVNFPYIIRATTSFGLKNVDSNITTKQK